MNKGQKNNKTTTNTTELPNGFKKVHGYDLAINSNADIMRFTNSGEWVQAFASVGTETPDRPNRKGYALVRARSTAGWKSFYVHHLMMQSFSPKHTPGDVIHHRDSNPLNNQLSNLQWITRGEHARHHAMVRVFAEINDKLDNLLRKLAA